MLVPKHRRLVECDMGSAVVEARNPAIVLTYTTHLFNYGSDITASSGVVATSEVYKEAMESFNASTFLDTCSSQVGLVDMQNFLNHFLLYLCAYNSDRSRYEQERNLPNNL